MNIAVVFGGKSVEHEISIITGMQAVAALIERGRDKVYPIYIDKGGTWHYSKHFVNIKNVKSKKVLAKSKKVFFAPSDNRLHSKSKFLQMGKCTTLARIDCVLPCMHGMNGEDGSVFAACQIANIPCASCGILPSSLAISKCATKVFLKGLGITVVPFVEMGRLERHDYLNKIMRAKLEFPLVVKPNRLGSSIGISLARDVSQLVSALDLAFEFDDKVIVERAIINKREFNCAVLERVDTPKKTIAAKELEDGELEIVSGANFYTEVSMIEEVGGLDEVLSFADKYLRDGKTKGMENLARQVPAKIEDKLKSSIERTSKKIFEQIDASGVIRIDYLFDEDTKRLYVNEINTIPGSLAYYLFKDLGMIGVVDRIIETAVAKFENSGSICYEFETPLHGKG